MFYRVFDRGHDMSSEAATNPISDHVTNGAAIKEAADVVERSYAKNGVLRELRNILGHARDYIAANSNE